MTVRASAWGIHASQGIFLVKFVSNSIAGSQDSMREWLIYKTLWH